MKIFNWSRISELEIYIKTVGFMKYFIYFKIFQK